MNAISEILQTLGIPVILAFIIWLVRLEGQVRQNKEKVETLWKETERLEQKHDNLSSSTNDRFNIAQNTFDKKLAETLDRLTDSINILTHATTKHDLMMENMEKALHELKDDIRNRPCISHYDKQEGR